LSKTNIRKKLEIVTAIMTLLIILGCAGFSVWAYSSTYETPSAEVTSLTSNPDFLVTIEWKKVAGAEYYVLEYEYAYDLYQGQTRVVHTTKTYHCAERVKGTMRFRIKAVFKKSESDFSGWKEYEIAPLILGTPVPFSIQKYAGTFGTEIKIVTGTWSPVTYYYRTNDGIIKEDYVNFFEYFVVAPGQDKETMILHPHTVVAATEFRTRDFNFAGTGIWKIYYRATTYDFAIQEIGDFLEKRIDKMYAASEEWVEVSITL